MTRPGLIISLLCAVTLVSIAGWSQEGPAAPEPSLPAAKALSERPLPNIPSLLSAVFDNQKKVEAIRKNYIFTRSKQDQQLDSDGRVKKTEYRKSEAFYIGISLVERVIEKDGRPLTESEQKKEQENVEKEIRKAREREAKREKRMQEEDENLTLQLSRLLNATEITNPRRELFHGREVLAFDFKPKPNFRPAKKEEELLHKLTGSLWVDEEARQIVRFEGRLLETVKFAGFLASVREGSKFTIEQQRVNDEIWLPSYEEGEFSARLLFKGMRVNSISRYSDYRKFRVETAITPASEVEAPSPR